MSCRWTGQNRQQMQNMPRKALPKYLWILVTRQLKNSSNPYALI